MLELVAPIAMTAGIAALVTNLLCPLFGRLAVVVRAVDEPGGRKEHEGYVARLGGVAILSGIGFGVGFVGLIELDDWYSPSDSTFLLALAFSTLLVSLVGLIDDIIGASALKKFTIEVIAACFLVGMGLQFEVLGFPGGEIQLGPLSGVVTVLWIVGVTNAINLLDGLDGLAAGVVAIIAGSFLVFSALQGEFFTVLLLAGIVGSCLGFLPHNWEPANLFMGDTGSLTLGFLLGATSVQAALKAPAAGAILVPVLALGVPVIDTALVMAMRFLERPKGKTFRRFLRMFHADRNHLHHLLEEMVTYRRSVVHWIYGMVLLSSVMALLVAATKQRGLGVALVAVEFAAIVLVRRLGMARRAEQLSHDKIESVRAHRSDSP